VAVGGMLFSAALEQTWADYPSAERSPKAVGLVRSWLPTEPALAKGR
jgi:hypothetical protein